MPQVEAAVIAHCVAGVGAWPVATGEQVPIEPVRAHDMQVPAQALLQQTPCAQKPELHIAAAVHGEPMANFPQVPVVCPEGMVQEAGEVQSPATVQLVLQAAVVPQA